MKITKITIQGFRAFDEPFEVDLGDGKNLLLYGENGSGKSSIQFALKQFFEERGADVSRDRNIFSAPARDPLVRVHLCGQDASGAIHDRDFEWTTAAHPLPVPSTSPPHPVTPAERSLLVDAARRSGFLDYRVLLRTSLFARPLPRQRNNNDYHRRAYAQDSEDVAEQIFDVVTWVLLDGVRMPVAGGHEATIGELIRGVWEKNPKSRHQHIVAAGEDAINEFNEGFGALLPGLEERVARLLEYFEGHDLEVTFEWQPLIWNRDLLRIENASLLPRIVFRGEELRQEDGRNFHVILNEARLSALALCVYFAGIQLSDTDSGNPEHPRFLVLDDALIGLELQNRIPVLRILSSPEFQHYQIFLLSHDRVWYDLARGYLPTTSNWMHRELIADHANGQLVPRIRGSVDDLRRAQDHLDNGDLRAAAVYARAAFETRLQNVCNDKGVKVAYKRNQNDLKVEHLWRAILDRQREREERRNNGETNVADFIPQILVSDVEIMRSNVLNQLSHSSPPSLVRAEVQTAISTIQALRNHPFPRAR